MFVVKKVFKKIHIIHPGCDEPLTIDSINQSQSDKIYDNSFPKMTSTFSELDKDLTVELIAALKSSSFSFFVSTL